MDAAAVENAQDVEVNANPVDLVTSKTAPQIVQEKVIQVTETTLSNTITSQDRMYSCPFRDIPIKNDIPATTTTYLSPLGAAVAYDLHSDYKIDQIPNYVEFPTKLLKLMYSLFQKWGLLVDVKSTSAKYIANQVLPDGNGDPIFALALDGKSGLTPTGEAQQVNQSQRSALYQYLMDNPMRITTADDGYRFADSIALFMHPSLHDVFSVVQRYWGSYLKDYREVWNALAFYNTWLGSLASLPPSLTRAQFTPMQYPTQASLTRFRFNLLTNDQARMYFVTALRSRLSTSVNFSTLRASDLVDGLRNAAQVRTNINSSLTSLLTSFVKDVSGTANALLTYYLAPHLVQLSVSFPLTSQPTIPDMVTALLTKLFVPSTAFSLEDVKRINILSCWLALSLTNIPMTTALFQRLNELPDMFDYVEDIANDLGGDQAEALHSFLTFARDTDTRINGAGWGAARGDNRASLASTESLAQLIGRPDAYWYPFGQSMLAYVANYPVQVNRFQAMSAVWTRLPLGRRSSFDIVQQLLSGLAQKLDPISTMSSIETVISSFIDAYPVVGDYNQRSEYAALSTPSKFQAGVQAQPGTRYFNDGLSALATRVIIPINAGSLVGLFMSDMKSGPAGYQWDASVLSSVNCLDSFTRALDSLIVAKFVCQNALVPQETQRAFKRKEFFEKAKLIAGDAAWMYDTFLSQDSASLITLYEPGDVGPYGQMMLDLYSRISLDSAVFGYVPRVIYNPDWRMENLQPLLAFSAIGVDDPELTFDITRLQEVVGGTLLPTITSYFERRLSLSLELPISVRSAPLPPGGSIDLGDIFPNLTSQSGLKALETSTGKLFFSWDASQLNQRSSIYAFSPTPRFMSEAVTVRSATLVEQLEQLLLRVNVPRRFALFTDFKRVPLVSSTIPLAETGVYVPIQQ